MGGWISYLLWGGDPDKVDPFSGLTKREVYAVQKSWTPVYADCVPNGTELLKRLFQAYPHTKEYFRTFRHLPEEEYATSTQFKAHVINLMTSLNLAVVNLNQPEVVAVMMVKVAESHHRRKIKQEDFVDLKKVLVKMFIEVLHLDSASLSAWDKTVDFWYKHMFLVLDSSEESR